MQLTGYTSVVQAIEELLLQSSRMDEKYKLDKNLAVQWGVDCLQKIGIGIYHPTPEPQYLEVKDHMAKLPNNLGILEAVYLCNANKESLYPLKYSGDINSRYIGTNTCRKGTNSDKSFYINYPYVITSFDNGCIMLEAKFILEDENGIPLFPDDEVFKDAVKSNIMVNWMYEPFIMGDIDANRYAFLVKQNEQLIQEAKISQLTPGILEQREIGKKISNRYNKYNLRRL